MSDVTVEQTCGTCKYAYWERMSKHKKPRPFGPGQCQFPLPPMPVVPSSVKQERYRECIWPDWATSCPCWEAK